MLKEDVEDKRALAVAANDQDQGTRTAEPPTPETQVERSAASACYAPATIVSYLALLMYTVSLLSVSATCMAAGIQVPDVMVYYAFIWLGVFFGCHVGNVRDIITIKLCRLAGYICTIDERSNLHK